MLDVAARAQQLVETKVIRHVRTEAGVRRYKQPIGSIIIADSLLVGLTEERTDKRGNVFLNGDNGKKYVITRNPGRNGSITYHSQDADTGETIYTGTDETAAYAYTARRVQEEAGIDTSGPGRLGKAGPRGSGYSVNQRAAASESAYGWGNTASDSGNQPLANELWDLGAAYDEQVGSKDDLRVMRHELEQLKTRDDLNLDEDLGGETGRDMIDAVIRDVVREAKLPKKYDADAEAEYAEGANARAAETASQPKPIKTGELSAGIWVRQTDKEGNPTGDWFKIDKVTDQSISGRSKLIRGTDRNGKAVTYYRQGPRDYWETVKDPSGQPSYEETVPSPENVSKPVYRLNRGDFTTLSFTDANGKQVNETGYVQDYIVSKDDWDKGTKKNPVYPVTLSDDKEGKQNVRTVFAPKGTVSGPQTATAAPEPADAPSVPRTALEAVTERRKPYTPWDNLKQVESDFPGYTKYEAADGTAAYQDDTDGTWWDENDNPLTEAQLRVLGTSAAAASRPGARQGPGWKQGKSEYPGYEKFTLDNGEAIYADKDGGSYFFFDENDNELGRAPGTDDAGLTSWLDSRANEDATLRPEQSEYEGYEKYRAPNGDAYYLAKERGFFVFYDKDDNEITRSRARQRVIDQLTDRVVAKELVRAAAPVLPADPPQGLKRLKSKYDGWKRYKMPDGKVIDVGVATEDDNRWYATGKGGWDDIVADGDTEAELMQKLNVRISTGADFAPNNTDNTAGRSAPPLPATMQRTLSFVDRNGGEVEGWAGQRGFNVNSAHALADRGLLERSPRRQGDSEDHPGYYRLTDAGRAQLGGSATTTSGSTARTPEEQARVDKLRQQWQQSNSPILRSLSGNPMTDREAAEFVDSQRNRGRNTSAFRKRGDDPNFEYQNDEEERRQAGDTRTREERLADLRTARAEIGEINKRAKERSSSTEGADRPVGPIRGDMDPGTAANFVGGLADEMEPATTGQVVAARVARELRDGTMDVPEASSALDFAARDLVRNGDTVAAEKFRNVAQQIRNADKRTPEQIREDVQRRRREALAQSRENLRRTVEPLRQEVRDRRNDLAPEAEAVTDGRTRALPMGSRTRDLEREPNIVLRNGRSLKDPDAKLLNMDGSSQGPQNRLVPPNNRNLMARLGRVAPDDQEAYEALQDRATENYLNGMTHAAAWKEAIETAEKIETPRYGGWHAGTRDGRGEYVIVRTMPDGTQERVTTLRPKITRSGTAEAIWQLKQRGLGEQNRRAREDRRNATRRVPIYGEVDDSSASAPAVQADPVVRTAEVQANTLRAVEELQAGQGAWVNLRRVRERLNEQGYTREEQDRALESLERDNPAVVLAPESNQKALTAADRAAAVRVGNQDNHLITIDPNYRRDSGAPVNFGESSPQSQEQIQARIRDIVIGMQGDGDWVSLVDVRDRMPDVPRADMDRALEAMLDDENVSIDPETHRHRLDDRAHAAAVHIGGEDRHRMFIFNANKRPAASAPNKFGLRIAKVDPNEATGKGRHAVLLENGVTKDEWTKAGFDAGRLDTLVRQGLVKQADDGKFYDMASFPRPTTASSRGGEIPQIVPAPGTRRRDDAAYKRDYERGWRASARPNRDLEKADARNESDAYYDGWSDYSVSNPKWKTADDKDNEEAARTNPRARIDEVRNHVAAMLVRDRTMPRDVDTLRRRAAADGAYYSEAEVSEALDDLANPVSASLSEAMLTQQGRVDALRMATFTGPNYNRGVVEDLARYRNALSKGEYDTAEAWLVSAEENAGVRPRGSYNRLMEERSRPAVEAARAENREMSIANQAASIDEAGARRLAREDPGRFLRVVGYRYFKMNRDFRKKENERHRDAYEEMINYADRIDRVRDDPAQLRNAVDGVLSSMRIGHAGMMGVSRSVMTIREVLRKEFN